MLQELFAVGWDIRGSFTRPQNAARRRSQISPITLRILAPGKPGIFQSQRFAHDDDQVQIPRACLAECHAVATAVCHCAGTLPADWAPTLRNRWFADSAQEGRVTSEPVSEMGFSGTGKLRSDSKTFMGWCRKRKGTIPARIGQNFGFCHSAGFPGDVFLRY